MLVMKPAGSWTISPFSQSRRATGNAVTSPVNLDPLSDSTACTPFEWFSVAVGGLLPEAVAFFTDVRHRMHPNALVLCTLACLISDRRLYRSD